MYIAVIRRDKRVWKTVYVKSAMNRGVVTIEGSRFVIELHTMIGNRLIYDVDEDKTLELALNGLTG